LSARTGTVAQITAEGAGDSLKIVQTGLGIGVEVENAETGVSLFVDANNTADADHALEIDDEATGATNPAVEILSARTGNVINVIAEGDASTIMILEADAAANSSAGLLIDINNTGGAGIALEIDDESTGAKTNLSVHSVSTGTIGLFDAEANAAQVVEIQSAGTGKGLLLDLNATTDSGIGLEIDDQSTGATNACVQIASVRTGDIVQITAEGAGDALNITQTGVGTAATIANTETGITLFLDANNTGDANRVISIDDEATGSTNPAVEILSARTGDIVQITAEGAGDALNITQTGLGIPVSVANAETGVTMFLDANNVAGTADHVLEIDDQSTGNTNTAVTIASARTGTVMDILAEGAASYGMEIDCANGNIGAGLYIDHNETDGAAVGMEINVASTSTNTAFAFHITGGATNAGVLHTGSVATDCAVDTVKAAIAVKVGAESTVYYIPLIDAIT